MYSSSQQHPLSNLVYDTPAPDMERHARAPAMAADDRLGDARSYFNTTA